ncbi:MAG: hypothetical protein NZ108_08200, partial [Bacteroidia bacterium]|nr:hypothetical protein [Bacteroidia bacterium]
IYPEMNDEDEQANRRTEFRIRTMNYKQTKTDADKKGKEIKANYEKVLAEMKRLKAKYKLK